MEIFRNVHFMNPMQPLTTRTDFNIWQVFPEGNPSAANYFCGKHFDYPSIQPRSPISHILPSRATLANVGRNCLLHD